MIKDITALILANGKSKRLRKEKAFININGTLLIDKITSELNELFDQIIIASTKTSLTNRFPQLGFVKDEFKDAGPLAGIHAGLKKAETDAVFVFACDMPDLNPHIILKQCEFFRQSGSDVLVPKHRDGLEPLHAIYTKRCLPNIETKLKSANFAVRSFFPDITLRYFDVKPEDIRCFRNINTNADLESEK
jgi:molybdopterin-guanine dinucleotide biosynthesis protein A